MNTAVTTVSVNAMKAQEMSFNRLAVKAIKPSVEEQQIKAVEVSFEEKEIKAENVGYILMIGISLQVCKSTRGGR